MIEGLKLTIPQRLQFLRIVVTISLLISVCLSINLWGGYRDFPHAPLLTFNFNIVPYDSVIISLSCFFLVASLFFKNTRSFIFLALLLTVFLILLDINRLQPWFFYYSIILFIFLFYNGRVDDSNKFTATFIILQFVIASIYLFSGISKINSTFVSNDFIELISPLKNSLTARQFLFVTKVGITIPYVLIFIGLGLIITPLRYLAITLGCVIHLCLIVFLLPSKSNQNYALWFMNIVFLGVLFLLFSGKTKQRYFSPAILFQKPLFYIIMILFWVFPFRNLTNNYPNNLASNFKSGNNNSFELTLTKWQLNQVEPYIKHFFVKKDTLYNLQYNKWCLHELKTDCYPEDIVFKVIYNQFYKIAILNVKETQFIIKPKQRLFSTK